jgi:hypothetical protein
MGPKDAGISAQFGCDMGRRDGHRRNDEPRHYVPMNAPKPLIFMDSRMGVKKEKRERQRKT